MAEKNEHTRGQKRPHELDNNPAKEYEEGNRASQRRKTSTSRPTRTASTKTLLACPFAKHNPTKYMQRRPCCGPGWTDIGRVKEHVYRCHSRPKYSCPRCFQTCESQADLNAHSRSEPPCKVLNGDLIPPDGIDEDQRAKIKSRKYNRTDGDSNPLDVSERWKHMYMVCFPDVAAEKVPSPHYHDGNAGASVHPMDGFAAFLHQDISASIQQQIQDEVERDPYLCRSGSDRLVNFIVKLTPRLIRSILTIYQESAQEQEYPDSTTTTARDDESSTGITTYSAASTGPTNGFTISPEFTYPDPPSHAAIPSNSGHNSNPSGDNPRDDSQLLCSLSTDPNIGTDLRHLHLLDGDLLRDLAWIDTDKYRF